ncbi:MAG: zinc-dependent peptidase [Cyclobacteriaceae bacterium]
MQIIALLLFLGVILAVIYLFFKSIYDIIVAFIDYFFGDKLHMRVLNKPLQTVYHEPIAKYFHYYKKLSPINKNLFERKVQKFIDSRQFIQGQDLDDIHPDMIALISATAIQVTFGFPRVYLEHFKRVHIYYDAFHSPNTGRYHYGEVNGKGAIVLSWKNFVLGLSNETNGRNLGLHEMAHALKIENSIRNSEYGFFDQSAYGRFHSEARWEMHRVHDGATHFFRDYAATNDHEFFAVAMENFFERPSEFREYNPKLYGLMSKLLRQNPMKIGYQLHEV